jgi:hypothetical protein
LTRRNFLLRGCRPNEIVVEWGATTKTTRKDRWVPAGWTLIREEHHPMMMTQLRETIRRLKEKEKFCTITTDRFRRWLQKDPATKHHTAHSIKRTVVGRLVDLAVQGKISPRVIPLLAKHKDDLHGFPRATLRYAPNKVMLARMLGSGEATRLLTL